MSLGLNRIPKEGVGWKGRSFRLEGDVDVVYYPVTNIRERAIFVSFVTGLGSDDRPPLLLLLLCLPEKKNVGCPLIRDYIKACSDVLVHSTPFMQLRHIQYTRYGKSDG